MKAQVFGSYAFLKPLILAGTKTYTTRIATDFRKKLGPGGLMYWATGIRTPNYARFATSRVLEVFDWWQEWILPPTIYYEGGIEFCPVSGLTIEQFARAEGFNSAQELKDFFNQKRYWGKELRTYHFELIDE